MRGFETVRHGFKKVIRLLDGLKLGGPRSIIVFEFTGFELYGAVCSIEITGKIRVGPWGVSRAPDLTEAVGQVLACISKGEQDVGTGGKAGSGFGRLSRLFRQKRGPIAKNRNRDTSRSSPVRSRKTGRIKLPRDAVLVAFNAGSGLSYLPVDPLSPLSREKMERLLQWDMEDAYARQNSQMTIGALLMGRGCIDSRQRKEIASLIDGSVQFGQKAVELGYVTREELDQCLQIQDATVRFDDEIIGRWAPQRIKVDADPEDEAERLFPWLYASCGVQMRRAWRKAFGCHGINLMRIYPQAGPPVLSVPEDDPNGPWILVETRQEQTILYKGLKGALDTLRIEPNPEGVLVPENLAAMCQEEKNPEITRIYLAGGNRELADSISKITGKHVEMLDCEEGTGRPGSHILPLATACSIKGAAAHFFSTESGDSAVFIPGRPKGRPFWKNKEIIAPLLAVMTVLAVVCFEGYQRYRIWQNELKLEELDIEFERKLALKSQVKQTVAKAHRMKKRLEEREKRLKELKELLNYRQEVVRRRQELVPGILRALSAASLDSVVIETLEMLEENDGPGSFRITGFTPRSIDGAQYIKRLNAHLASLGYKVLDVQMVKAEGPLGISGYRMEIKTAPAQEPAGKEAS